MARNVNGAAPSSEVINFGNSSTFAPANITVAAWVNSPGSGGSFYSIVNREANPQNATGDWALGIGSVNGIYIENGNGGFFNSSAPVIGGDGRWHHLGFTMTNGSATITPYVDGVVASGAQGGFVNWGASTASESLVMGPKTPSGGIGAHNSVVSADLAIWNTVLAASQFAQLAAGVRPAGISSANLQGYWPLDGYASPETDASGNGNTGALTGTTQVLGPPVLWRVSQGA